MDFIDKFKSALPEEIDFEELYELAPADLWKSDPRKAGALALNRAYVFDSDRYLEKNPDVRKNGIDPIQHYVNNGIEEGRSFFLPNKLILKKLLNKLLKKQ